jgi:hypothetical protein
MKWRLTSNELPKKNTPIIWKSLPGQTATGKYLGGAVWMLDEGIYVYYKPIEWAYTKGSEQ